MASKTSLASIQDFLNQPRLALIGVSRNPNDYSRAVLEDFQRRDYQVLLVTPHLTELQGEPCYGSVTAIHPPPSAALVLVADAAVAEVTSDCLHAGVQHLWFRHARESSREMRRAVDAAVAAGCNVIEGECPLMFLPEAGWVHRAHGFLNKITGGYPC